jgi:predicted small secreted protein
MKTQSSKRLLTAIFVLSAMLLDGCGGGGGDGDGGDNGNGAETSESDGNTNVLSIKARHISHEDTRPTLDAVAAGIDP